MADGLDDKAASKAWTGRETLLRVLKSLTITVREADISTSHHLQVTGRLCYRLARRMGQSRREAFTLFAAGLVHDIGKLAIPASILLAPRRLTAHEYELVKGHVAVSVRILQPIGLMLPGMVEIIAQHHERLDGSGYPLGLVGQDIVAGAKILAAVDVAHAILSHRPYRVARPLDNVAEELRRPGYDQMIVDLVLSDPSMFDRA